MAHKEFADGTRILRVSRQPDGKLKVKVRSADAKVARWLVLSQAEYLSRKPRLAT